MIISASPEITILHGVSIAKSLRLGDVIALTPPITITPEEIDHSTQLIASTLTQLA